MSTDQDRSIKSGMGIPQWVKKNMETRYDFDQSTFSPPAHEEDFFYLRYPKFTQSKTEAVTSEQTIHTIQANDSTLVQHTKPCKEYLPFKDESLAAQQKVIKPKGTDDGFYHDGAACGKSILAVAQQMISGQFQINTKVRGFTTDDTGEQHPSAKYLRQRRNSKSLPASPLTSPVSSPTSSPIFKRKMGTNQAPQNRFFTAPFASKEVAIKEEERKPSWLLSGILSQKREDTVALKQESALVERKRLGKDSGDESDSEQVKLAVGVEIKPVSSEKPSGMFKAKPSELREMNFWSPTSM